MNKLAREIIKVAKELLAEEKSKFKVDELVWINGNKRTTFKITKVNTFSGQNTTFFTYELLNLRNHKTSNSISEIDLMPIGKEIVDKEGRNASTAANEIFNSKEVIIDFHRTTNQTYGKITNIDPKGVVTVQTYIAGEAIDIEHYKVDKTTKSEVEKFKPLFFQHEWRWTNGSQNIEPYKGGNLTRLLD